MTPFRQQIHRNQSGRDVKAVKRTLKRMGVHGASEMNSTNVCGVSVVAVLKALQRSHGLVQDGVYGPKTHALVAPHFKRYDVWLYKSAKLRPPDPSPVPHGTAQQMAKRLLVLHAQGRYRAVNSGDLYDIERTALGKSVWSQGGYWVNIDHRPLELIVFLIDTQGYKIGTYAICSDHHNDGRHGHAGGFAVDIEEIDLVPVGNGHAHDLTFAVARALNRAPGELRPRQEICDGYGYMHSADISTCCIPYASFYGSETLSEHRNHIHAGF